MILLLLSLLTPHESERTLMAQRDSLRAALVQCQNHPVRTMRPLARQYPTRPVHGEHRSTSRNTGFYSPRPASTQPASRGSGESRGTEVGAAVSVRSEAGVRPALVGTVTSVAGPSALSHVPISSQHPKGLMVQGQAGVAPGRSSFFSRHKTLTGFAAGAVLGAVWCSTHHHDRTRYVYVPAPKPPKKECR